ncbi:hypothetical protein Rhal01_01473 [Rubritalea halochordaticola]|uniref:Bile acid:sodium symporter n=1 Tax=Rubritalea halochordaticola TaxID=714537 RepID=A0ABP9UYH5_9BACT
MQWLRQIIGNFTFVMLVVVLLASVLPARGVWVGYFDALTKGAIALLFFMHGAKLSRKAIVAGAGHWRLHLAIFGCTFVMFPLLGLAFKSLWIALLGDALALGMLYLCALPATVQSAIAFTSIARGNIPAAVCSASASSLLGIFVTPVLVQWTMGKGEGQLALLDAVLKISLQLLLPFLLGHFFRPWLGSWVDRNRSWLKSVDQGSIQLVVYTAFSAAVVGGMWEMVSGQELLLLVLACCVLLGLAIVLTTLLGRVIRFSLEDRIALLFCGSKKSLATGVPMAQVLFAGGALVGPLLLPVMVFHQIQLMVCAVLAQRWGKRA